jgi:hypothetical protein
MVDIRVFPGEVEGTPRSLREVYPPTGLIVGEGSVGALGAVV